MLDLNNLEQPYLIAEIGINHNGDLQIAKKLIDAAFACSWDCVKFQKREPDLCVPEHQKGAIRETPWGTMTYIEYKHRIEFSRKEYDYIDKYCKEKPLSWSASVWDIPSMEFIAGYDVPFIKLPSAMLVEKDLLIMACRTGKPIILSTGMSTLEEIDEAVNILGKYASQFALMHVNSAYPAPIEELNIRCIQTLKERYQCEVGYRRPRVWSRANDFCCCHGCSVDRETYHDRSYDVGDRPVFKRRGDGNGYAEKEDQGRPYHLGRWLESGHQK